MRISIQLGKLVKHELSKRGLIKRISERTGLERHTVSSLIHGTCKYVSLDALGKICKYLIDEDVLKDPSSLPGSLFGREPDDFVKMLSDCERVEFAVGVRAGTKGHERAFVAASDSHLHGVLLSLIAKFEMQARNEKNKPAPGGHEIPEPHQVPSPAQGRVEESPEEWEEGKAKAFELENNFEARTGSAALLAVGSGKVNPAIELMVARAFGAEPFESQDEIDEAENRACPLFFRYRLKKDGYKYDDPLPPSCFGGIELASNAPSSEPGIYVETADGSWVGLPSDGKSHDAAFVFYDYRANEQTLKAVVGGYSGAATFSVATHIDRLVHDLWPPQYDTPERKIGMFAIQIEYSDPPGAAGRSGRESKLKVVRIDDTVMLRRLERNWSDPDDQDDSGPKKKSKRKKKVKA